MWLKRRVALTLFASLAISGLSGAQTALKRVLLIPLDDRPAATQFAQMIGRLADVRVETPPAETLGHFLSPGKPDSINKWLSQHLSDYDALIVNTDMIAYGGLIASRTDRTSYATAINRLREFWRIRKLCQNLKVYGFSSIMRLAPTATKQSKPFAADLSRFVELKSLYEKTQDQKTKVSLDNLQKKLPVNEIERYYLVRSRDFKVQQELIRMCGQGGFDNLVLGQDDARPNGPHVSEALRLKQMSSNLGVVDKVHFTDGIDQLANVLLSRALLSADNYSPKVRVVFADEAGRQKIAYYESDTIDNNLKEQIMGSGATIAKPNETFDYSLYVNTPNPRTFALDAFLKSMKSEVDQGMPVAVADVNLGKIGTGDPKLFEALTSQGRSSRILSYAGWNTPGNTMGTTIPAANVYMLARRASVDPLQREVALRAFILHRLVNDFEYHKYVRPEAYAMIDRLPNASREETYGENFEKVNELVKEDLGERLAKRFNEQLAGTQFFAGNQKYEVTELTNVSISLPWPRAYEVRLDFEIRVRNYIEGNTPFNTARFPILPLGGGRG